MTDVRVVRPTLKAEAEAGPQSSAQPETAEPPSFLPNPVAAQFTDQPAPQPSHQAPSVAPARPPATTTTPSAPAEATSTTAPLEAQPRDSDTSTDTTDLSSDTGDSTLGSEYDPSSYTASLTSSITAYQHEHGRRYHAYQAGRYVLPNDEQEQERMDLQYHAIRLAFGDKIFFAPLPTSPAPTAILDVGTGTGIWVVDCADALPETTVIGTDLSPIQPRWIPTNVKFEVDDAEQTWTFPNDHFDLVHTRIMNGSLRNWHQFFEQTYQHVKPGGWVECHELSVDAKSDDGSLNDESYVHKWCVTQAQAFSHISSTLLISGEEIKDWMEKAGFVNVQIRMFKLPIGTWPADPKLRECGAFQLVAMLDGIQGLTIAPWVKFLGWSEEEVEVFLAKVRGEWRSRRVHSYWPLYAVYGQKPAA